MTTHFDVLINYKDGTEQAYEGGSIIPPNDLHALGEAVLAVIEQERKDFPDGGDITSLVITVVPTGETKL